MEKNLKRVKTIVVLALVILVSLIAFCGIYAKNNGIWKNYLKKYNFGMELSGFRELHFVLDPTEEEKEVYVDDNGNIIGKVEDGEDKKEEGVPLEENKEEVAKETAKEPELKKETRKIKANEDSAINIENFELSKKVIQKRLENFNSYEYNIRMDNVTGELVLELPDDEDLGVKEALVTTRGEIEIIDRQTGVVLLKNSNVKSAASIVSNQNAEYQIYLQIKFDEVGAEKLKEISKEYKQTTDGAGEDTTKYVSVKYDDQIITTTYFGDELGNGEIFVPLGNPTSDANEYSVAKEQADRIAKIINEEEMPLVYQLKSDNYIKSEITDEMVLVAKIVFAVILVVVSAILIVKFKASGVKMAILAVAYVAILSLVIRYANVTVTLNSLIAFVASVIINYVFVFKMLKELKINSNSKIAFGNTLKELYFAIVPVCIIALIFTFMASTIINSIGMTLFWGLFVQVVYNGLIVLINII